MKEFDLEKAKAGAKVCTRAGGSVRILCWDRNGDAPIIALVRRSDGNEDLYSYFESGFYLMNGQTNFDLMLEGEKKEGWVNIYKISNTYRVSTVYANKKVAESAATEIDKYIATIHIEWEE